MLLISLKDESKNNPAVYSSPSSWGRTWIIMTQQSSTAPSMEKTSSLVWKISGRPGRLLKVKKDKQANWNSPLHPSCHKSDKHFGFHITLATVCVPPRKNMLLLLLLLCTSTLPASFVGGVGGAFQDFIGLGTSQLLVLAFEYGHKSIKCCFVFLPL